MDKIERNYSEIEMNSHADGNEFPCLWDARPLPMGRVSLTLGTTVSPRWDERPKTNGMVWENYRHIKIAEKPCVNRHFSDFMYRNDL